MNEETKEKKRERKPRIETHQNALEAFHAWCKAPFADTAATLKAAMIAHLRVKHGDDGIDSVKGF